MQIVVIKTPHTMELFLNCCYFTIGLITKLSLRLRGKNPIIIYFTCEPVVGINDLPQYIKWKAKNCWKVEIEEIGRVSKNGCQILNNKRLKTSLTLKVYGRKNKIATKQLDLNHKKVSLHRLSTFPELNFQFEELSYTYGLISLQKQIYSFQSSMATCFYSCQENHSLEQTLLAITPPQKINTKTEVIVSIMDKLKETQENFFQLHYDKELNYHINKT